MIVWPTKPCGYDYCRPSNYGTRLSGLIRAAAANRDAEPEADAYYGYYGFGHRPYGYGYGNGYGHVYGFGHGFGYYGKRSADAAANPEDKAEP